MVLPPPQTKEFHDRIVVLEDECRVELDQSMQSTNEIVLLLQKTNSEVEKLASRELQFSNRVRDMEMHLDNYSREDIRDLFTNAHEIQLRLFMMRSQAEQLQNRQQHIKEYQAKLHLLLNLLALQASGDASGAAGIGSARATTLIATPGTQVLGENSVLSIIEAQEDERLRISRQIHDGPTQSLANLVLRAEICERLIDRDLGEARQELVGLKAMINASLQDTRRMIFDLRPMILEDLGLVPTVRRYLVELNRTNKVQGEVTGPEQDLGLNTTMQVALFRFVQATLAALMAEGAAEHVDIQIERHSTTVILRVEAFAFQGERSSVEERLLDAESHFQHRLKMLDADMTTEQRTNRGLCVELAIPIPDEAML
ncbi:MAG: histidine kinase [Chloroflexota bacterium]|nr:histidine kinase [Chloroflexota bacterium]